MSYPKNLTDEYLSRMVDIARVAKAECTDINAKVRIQIIINEIAVLRNRLSEQVVV